MGSKAAYCMPDIILSSKKTKTKTKFLYLGNLTLSKMTIYTKRYDKFNTPDPELSQEKKG